MWKSSVCALAAALALGGCTSTGMSGDNGFGIGQAGSGLVKMYVKNQCVNELQSRNEWRLVALAMSQQQQAEWEDKICGCAGEEVPNQLSAADLTQLVSEEGRTKVMADVTVKTVTACFKRLYSK